MLNFIHVKFQVIPTLVAYSNVLPNFDAERVLPQIFIVKNMAWVQLWDVVTSSSLIRIEWFFFQLIDELSYFLHVKFYTIRKSLAYSNYAAKLEPEKFWSLFLNCCKNDLSPCLRQHNLFMSSRKSSLLLLFESWSSLLCAYQFSAQSEVFWSFVSCL